LGDAKGFDFEQAFQICGDKQNMIHIPFNKPYMTGQELGYITEAHANRHLAGDGVFTKRCHAWLEGKTGTSKALLTHSCTAALEMSAMLAKIAPGDEVIMPSYTFVSTANAFVLRGGIPVFVDIRDDTLNLDESLIEAALTPRTRAIVPVHYAGVSCEMDTIMSIAKQHKLLVIEDAAQGVTSTYKNKALGSIGDFGAYSFHETKNVISGEGGALLINSPKHVAMAEIIREKGTDRSRFFRGQVDKYTWQETGSSFLPGELIAAFLWAQLEQAESITTGRLASWHYYHELLQEFEIAELLRRPIVPKGCSHNAHMYYVLLASHIDRDFVLDKLKRSGIGAVFHYVPLHSSPAGKAFGRVASELPITDSLSGRLIRLPLWSGLARAQQEEVVDGLKAALLQAL
jgi:dTDP-4-amino-4,6-dideoxygalactose transaminase